MSSGGAEEALHFRIERVYIKCILDHSQQLLRGRLKTISDAIDHIPNTHFSTGQIGHLYRQDG